MKCTSCGSDVAAGANYCIHCGAAASIRCDACGEANPASAKYCLACGTPLRAAIDDASGTTGEDDAPEERQVERRQLTVLFCDLVSSTAMSSRLDPEDLRVVIRAYHRCVAETVRRYDGFVARYMGDGALVYFGYPRSQENNAERAVRAALALLADVPQLRTLAEPLALRIGIATGLVVVGPLVSADAAREQVALGETPNLASRLQAIAKAGTVVIGDLTKRLAGDGFQFRDLGTKAAKGFAHGIRAWEVIGARRPASRLAAVGSPAETPASAANSDDDAPLLGRNQERGLLREAWAHACEGRGRVVLLAGDPGIGKSRLLRALMDDLSGEPHYELVFRCSQEHGGSPLYPIVHLLPRVIGFARSDSDEQRLDKLKTFCARHGLSTSEPLALLSSLLGLTAPAGTMPPMSADRQKQRTLQAFLDILLSFASERPVLMAVEDVHWIDPTTMEFLTLAIGQLPTARVLGVLTTRLPLPPAWTPHSHLTPLVLTRLDRRQARALVDRLASGARLPENVVQSIVARTDGVPLFIEELTKAVVESTTAAEGHGERGEKADIAIPASLQDSLIARLDRMGPAKEVAQVASVIGREFPYALLLAVCERDERSLQQELARLVDAEFIYPRGSPPDARYVFKHALIQEAASQSLLRRTRQRFHRAIARSMVEQTPGDADAHPELVARHWTEAGEPLSAIPWWRKAGQRSFAGASYAEAVGHYQRGLDAVRSMPRSEERDVFELELQVELGYAIIPLKGWAAPESADAFRRAGEVGRGLGDDASQFRATWGLGAFHFVRGDQRPARDVADRALRIASRCHDADALMEARYLRGIVACASGDFADGRADLEECLALYGSSRRERHRLLYGQDAKASAHGWLAMALCAMGEPDAGLEHAHQALDWVRESMQPFLLARGLAAVGFVHTMRGEPGQADPFLRDALGLCVEQKFTYFHAVVSAFHGACLAGLGDAARGIDVTNASLRTLRALGARLLFTIIHSDLARACLAAGRIEQGLEAVDEGLAMSEASGERWALSELHRLRGELELAGGRQRGVHAEAHLAQALEIAAGQKAETFRLRAAISLARLLLQRGQSDRARALIEDALRAWASESQTSDVLQARSLVACAR